MQSQRVFINSKTPLPIITLSPQDKKWRKKRFLKRCLFLDILKMYPIYEDMIKRLVREDESFQATQILGEGADGTAVRVCQKYNCYVAKIFKEGHEAATNAQYELMMTQKFYDIGIGPGLYNMVIGRKKQYAALFGEVDIMLRSYLYNAEYCSKTIQRLVDELYETVTTANLQGYAHLDLHYGNIGLVLGPDEQLHIQLLDFGRAVHYEEINPEQTKTLKFLDGIILLYNDIETQTATEFYNLLVEKYNEDPSIAALYKDFDFTDMKQYDTMWSKHVKPVLYTNVQKKKILTEYGGLTRIWENMLPFSVFGKHISLLT